MDAGSLISGSFAFSKSSLNIWKFSVHVHWSLAWKILSIILLACKMSAAVLIAGVLLIQCLLCAGHSAKCNTPVNCHNRSKVMDVTALYFVGRWTGV